MVSGLLVATAQQDKYNTDVAAEHAYDFVSFHGLAKVPVLECACRERRRKKY